MKNKNYMWAIDMNGNLIKVVKVMSAKPRKHSLSRTANPKRVVAGRAGGLACAGKPRKFNGRAPNGTVNFKNMTQCAKRAYWRAHSSKH